MKQDVLLVVVLLASALALPAHAVPKPAPPAGRGEERARPQAPRARQSLGPSRARSLRPSWRANPAWRRASPERGLCSSPPPSPGTDRAHGGGQARATGAAGVCQTACRLRAAGGERSAQARGRRPRSGTTRAPAGSPRRRRARQGAGPPARRHTRRAALDRPPALRVAQWRADGPGFEPEGAGHHRGAAATGQRFPLSYRAHGRKRPMPPAPSPATSSCAAAATRRCAPGTSTSSRSRWPRRASAA